MKILRKLLFVVILLFSISSVKVYAQDSILNTVAQVRVICHRGSLDTTKVYVQPHKIESILNYLRLLNVSNTVALVPDSFDSECIEIILLDANGQQNIYRQKANQYFSKNSHPWRHIPQQQAVLLYPLIESMPTDKKSVLQ